ncbi:MAG: CHAP domain-containing protein [Solobacterium sp.]|nr:CHAP domain-containing protein [Solobacterium sp.]
MKKLLYAFTALMTALCTLNPVSVLAEEDDFSDTEYWNNLCSKEGELTEEQKKSCQAYMDYMATKNQELESEIAMTEARKQEIAANIANYQVQIDGFNAQIAGIQGIIEDLNMQIKAIEEQITDINRRIEENRKAAEEKEEQIEQLKLKVGDRMEEQQKTMRFYQFLDVLFGAQSFDAFIRLANGLNAIYSKDYYSLTTLNDSVVELNRLKEGLLEDQKEVEAMEAELEEGRAVVAAQQASLVATRSQLEAVKAQYNAKLKHADSEILAARDAIAANRDKIGDISNAINATPKPVETPDIDSPDSGDSEEGGSGDTSGGGNSDSGSSAPNPAPVSGGENPYWGGWSNCTWGAWQLVHDTLGISLPGWGMAGNWLNDAAASGYSTGSAPRVNSIAVYSWHVAFVTAVNGDQVYIKEGNYLGHYNERWVPASGSNYTGQTCLGYIYL